MLKHLGPIGLEYLTTLLNLSLHSLDIPAIWKRGRVVPLPKPGKPSGEGKSFRPITLLLPVAKTLESLLLPTLVEHLPPASHQHGFRKRHSTTTALTAIASKISYGLNQRMPASRTVALALDLSKAFDTVRHSTLLADIRDSTLPPSVKRWLASYLNGRLSFVEFRNTKSRCRRVKQGVPQGGVLSPTLFNAYISKLPTPPDGIEIILYADDCTVLASGPDYHSPCTLLNGYLECLERFFTSRNLQLSVEKSSATLFTTWSLERKAELNIMISGRRIPTINEPKLLGVVFDSMFTFGPHAKNIKDRLRNRNNVIKSLAGSTWGKDKETLLTT